MKRFFALNIASLIILDMILQGCSPVTNLSVHHVNQPGALQTASLVFALPLTVIDVRVNAEEVTIIPGPFYQYAEKYLGIKDVPEKQERLWVLRELTLAKHTEADPDFLYALKGIQRTEDDPRIIKLLADGLILDATAFSAEHMSQFTGSSGQENFLFTDLSVKRNFETKKDTDISLVMPGTDDDSAPVSGSNLRGKTLEQKAEEAANFLIKLKKRRFKLVSGQYDYMPAGEAMEDALQELARLEEAYLSLFIGKRITSQYQQYYRFIPDEGKEVDRVVLFRFSPQEGLVDAREAVGLPVVVELTDDNKTKLLEQYRVPLKPAGKQLHYRIADQVHVKLRVGEQVWAEAFYPVFQCGAMVPMNLE